MDSCTLGGTFIIFINSTILEKRDGTLFLLNIGKCTNRIIDNLYWKVLFVYFFNINSIQKKYTNRIIGNFEYRVKMDRDYWKKFREYWQEINNRQNSWKNINIGNGPFILKRCWTVDRLGTKFRSNRLH